MIEKSLVVLKFDTIKRWLIWRVISRLEDAWLKVVWAKMCNPSKEHYFKHYEEIWTMITRRWQKAFDITLEMMMSWPVLALVIEWVECVELIRKLVWATEPKSAAPWTIRWDFAHVSFKHSDETNSPVRNLVHASGNSQEAQLEIKLWFNDEELFQY